MKKKLIIIIVITILIIIALLGILLLKKDKEKIGSAEREKESTSGLNNTKPLSNNTELFEVQSCIQNFIDQINVNNVTYYTGGERIEQSMISKWTYSLLSQEYIDKNKITEENVYDYVNNVQEELIFTPLKINVLECGNTNKYAVYGFTQTQMDEYIEDVYFILNVDSQNMTFSIEPIFNINSIEDINLTEKDLTIESNEYNDYEEKEITDEDVCEQYLLMYKRIMLAQVQLAYSYLNEEYRNEKFDSLQEYTSYIENNKDMISQIELDAYKIDGKEYMLQDQWKNYYIFNINEVLDYNVMLDIYTIGSSEFIDKYNSATDQEKVALNINKVVAAINNKDYDYVYKKLADSFKNNYFSDIDTLKQYLESNLYDRIEVEYNDFQREGNVYTYKIRVIKQYGEGEELPAETNAESKDLNVVMKLGEGTDFVMSFSIEG